MHLSDSPKAVRYNQWDRRLFAAIPQDGSTIDIKQLIYVRLQHEPSWNVLHPRNIISTYMIRLQDKIIRNREPFVLHRRGSTREIVHYWLTPKKPTGRSSRAGDTRTGLFS